VKKIIHPTNKPLFVTSKENLIVNDGKVAWKNVRGSYKKGIKNILLPCQFNLCAYCEIELSESENNFGCHIEHVKPKSIYPLDTFKLENLVLSCFKRGNEAISTEYDLSPVSCGHFKQSRFDENLFLKPTDDIEDLFYYEINGLVIPNKKIVNIDLFNKVKHTIESLNLNCKRLVRKREEVILEGYSILLDLSGHKDAEEKFIKLEVGMANDKTFAFISLRKQHFGIMLASVI
jgi:uncharacterized protein (TIGR02646 family)